MLAVVVGVGVGVVVVVVEGDVDDEKGLCDEDKRQSNDMHLVIQ